MNWRRLVGLEKQPTATTGLGLDFPEQSGGRERGKFRESAYPRLTTVAVSTDGGEPVAQSTDQLLAELVYEVKLMRHALVLGGMAADIDEPIK